MRRAARTKSTRICPAPRGIPNFATAKNSAAKNPGLPRKAEKIPVGFFRATPPGQILFPTRGNKIWDNTLIFTNGYDNLIFNI